MAFVVPTRDNLTAEAGQGSLNAFNQDSAAHGARC